MIHTNLLRSALLIGALVLSLSACSTTSSSVKSDSKHSAWLDASPMLKQKIDDNVKRLPWTHGLERVELIRWFASVGEPAYPKLLELVVDPSPDVAGSALAALGATKDSRLVEPLRALPWPAEVGSDLALERARALLRLGDWEMVPHLISGLRSDELMIRALSGQALYEATHERFGFDPRAEADARETSVKQWEAWWHSRKQDPLLTKTTPVVSSPASGD